MDHENAVKRSNESPHTIHPNDTFQAGYYIQGHPSFQEKQYFIS